MKVKRFTSVLAASVVLTTSFSVLTLTASKAYAGCSTWDRLNPLNTNCRLPGSSLPDGPRDQIDPCRLEACSDVGPHRSPSSGGSVPDHLPDPNDLPEPDGLPDQSGGSVDSSVEEEIRKQKEAAAQEEIRKQKAAAQEEIRKQKAAAALWQQQQAARRQQAELQRQQAELLRQQQAARRQQAELRRQQAVTRRQQAELQRQQQAAQKEREAQAQEEREAQAQREQEAQAQREQEAQAQKEHPTAQLAEWGWAKVACYPGAVFIMGMGDDTICVNPSAAIVGGQYQYERASNQLIPLAAVSNPAPVPVSNPAAAAASNPAPAAEQPAAPPPPSDVVPVQNPEPPDTEGF